MKKVLFLLLISSQAFAQNVLISKVNDPKEACIKINPKKPNQLIAGSVMNGFHISNDTGRTWSSMKMESDYNVWGDPVVDIDANGKFYYFHLSYPKKGYYIDRIVLQTSENEGKTWTDGKGIGYYPPKQQDKHWCFINPTNNEIYLSWTQFDKYGSKKSKDESNILFSKSINSGKDWTPPVKVNNTAGDCLDNDKTVEGAMTEVGNDGKIYCCWAGRKGIYFNQSNNRGASWSKKEHVIEKLKGGWSLNIPGLDRANGFPILKVDRSNSIFNNTIYVAFADQRNGKRNTDIFFIKSKDGGKTWSKAIRVNQDDSKRHQYGMWFDIDPKTGVLYFMYYDRRYTQGNATDVFLAYSKDGGQTFKERKISETSFTPDSKKFFGDYNGLSVEDGIIRPIWTRYDNGEFSIWTTLLSQQELP